MGAVVINVPPAKLKTRGIAPKRETLTQEIAARIADIYEHYWPECTQFKSESGKKYFFYPKLLNRPIYRDGAAGGDQERDYFHAGDLIAYRGALRVIHGPGIQCVDREPINYVRPVLRPAEQDLLSKVY